MLDWCNGVTLDSVSKTDETQQVLPWPEGMLSGAALGHGDCRYCSGERCGCTDGSARVRYPSPTLRTVDTLNLSTCRVRQQHGHDSTEDACGIAMATASAAAAAAAVAAAAAAETAAVAADQAAAAAAAAAEAAEAAAMAAAQAATAAAAMAAAADLQPEFSCHGVAHCMVSEEWSALSLPSWLTDAAAGDGEGDNTAPQRGAETTAGWRGDRGASHDTSRLRRACQPGYMDASPGPISSSAFLAACFAREWAATAPPPPPPRDAYIATSDRHLTAAAAAATRGFHSGLAIPATACPSLYVMGPEDFKLATSASASDWTILSRPSLLAAGISSLLDTLVAAPLETDEKQQQQQPAKASGTAASNGCCCRCCAPRGASPGGAAAPGLASVSAAASGPVTRGSRQSWAASARRRIGGLGRQLASCFLPVASRQG